MHSAMHSSARSITRIAPVVQHASTCAPVAAVAAVSALPSAASMGAASSLMQRHSSTLSLHRPPPPPRAPTRVQTIAVYRALHRSIFQCFYTASQYATFDELAGEQDSISGRSPGAAWRKENFALPKNEAHVTFAKKRSAAWLKIIKQGFADHANEKDPAVLQRLHRHAEEMAQLMVSNMEHSRYLLEGGWGIRRDNSKVLSNVAHKVGLQMPKPGIQSTPWIPAGTKHQKARDERISTVAPNKFVK